MPGTLLLPARRRAAQQARKFCPKDVRCHEGYLYCLCSRPGEAIVTVPVDDRHAHRKHVCYSRAFHEFIHGSVPRGESERGEQGRDRIREQFEHTTTVVVPFGVGKSPLCCLCCLRPSGRFGQSSDRAGLQDGDAAIAGSPLNIYWLTVEALDLDADGGKGSWLGRAERRPAAPIWWHRFLVRTQIGTHGHHILIVDLLSDDLSTCLVNHDRIGRHLPTDNGFTQPPGSVDHHLVACSCQRIRGEEDACRVGGHKLLDHHRQAHIFLRDALAGSGANSPPGPERSPAAVDGIADHPFAMYV